MRIRSVPNTVRYYFVMDNELLRPLNSSGWVDRCCVNSVRKHEQLMLLGALECIFLTVLIRVCKFYESHLG